MIDITEENSRLKGEAGVLRALLSEAQKWIEIAIKDEEYESDEGYQMARLSDKISAALEAAS